MLVLVHGHGPVLEQASAHAVGALHAFGPDRTRHQACLRCRMGEGRVAEVVEQYAFAVGEDDRIARTGQLLVQIGHFGLRHGLHVEQAVLAFLQIGRGHDLGFVAGAGIELVVVEAAYP